MKVLFAADGSTCTKKALAFLITHPNLVGNDDELVVLNVQHAMSAHVASRVGSDVVSDAHREEAEKVLDPIKEFLGRHPIKFRCIWVVGNAADEIVLAGQREKAHMLVLGTHGYGLLGRAVMGSVAQQVVEDCEVPVLLVK
jgi:nucleotide-binding universal stress UspA family protein